jgi:hypothetical protein
MRQTGSYKLQKSGGKSWMSFPLLNGKHLVKYGKCPV